MLPPSFLSTRYGHTLALIAFGHRHARAAALVGAALLMAAPLAGHTITFEIDGELRIGERVVVLDSSRIDTLIVIPV